ncbi:MULTISPECIES: FecR domain-containing protein [Methylotenera]|uniref:FecR domain-containing protein n=1 Tax=Methylotenera TaxID=359407 RepID=UPI000365D812|nr:MULTISPECIES: FecR domain-containing protein [Methylotenera]
MSNPIAIASEWYVKLNESDCSEEDRAAFEAWKDASSLNLNAWNRILQVSKPFDGLEPVISKEVLLQRRTFSLSRRHLLKNLGIVAVATGTGLIAYHQKPWQAMLADYTTHKGEIKTLYLSDETMLVLNSDTAIDQQYDDKNRTIKLIKGEVLIETGHGKGASKPFSVRTKYGTITALGTRFSVRQHRDYVSVNVYKDAVSIQTFANNGFKQKLYENHTTIFNDQILPGIKPLRFGTDLWTKGILSVVDMPLNEFLIELDRYYIGYLRCDPAIANVLVSGSFPLNDIDAIFSSLQHTHSLRIHTVSKYWVTFKPV